MVNKSSRKRTVKPLGRETHKRTSHVSQRSRAVLSGKLMVSISGLRGVVGESLTPEVVIKYANAFSVFSGREKIVVGGEGG